MFGMIENIKGIILVVIETIVNLKYELEMNNEKNI